jgi:protease II
VCSRVLVLESDEDLFFILSNKDDQHNYGLYYASVKKPLEWHPVMPYNSKRMPIPTARSIKLTIIVTDFFEKMQVFENHLVLFERSDSLMRVKIVCACVCVRCCFDARFTIINIIWQMRFVQSFRSI